MLLICHMRSSPACRPGLVSEFSKGGARSCTSTHCWNSGSRSPYEAVTLVTNKARAATQKKSCKLHLCLTTILVLLMSFRRLRRGGLQAPIRFNFGASPRYETPRHRRARKLKTLSKMKSKGNLFKQLVINQKQLKKN